MRLVFALVACLVLSIWGFAVRDFVQQWQRYQAGLHLLRQSQVIDHLVLAGRDLIFERGRVNVRLAAATPLDQDNAGFIERMRRQSDHNLDAAIARLPAEITAELRQYRAALAPVRAEMDRQLLLPGRDRDPSLRKHWFAASSRLLDALFHTLHQAALRDNRFEPSFRLITRIKMSALALRNALGEESARIGAAAALGQVLDRASLHDLARLRGKAEALQDQIHNDIEAAGQVELAAALNQVENVVGERLRPLQDEILARSLAGVAMVLPASSYSSVAVPALQEVNVLFDRAQEQSAAMAEGIADGALRMMLVSAAVTVLALVLGVGCLLILRRRLIRPLFGIGEELRRLTAASRNWGIGHVQGDDELGELRTAVAAFRDMLSDRLALWQALPDMIVYKGGDGRWLTVNIQACRYLQVPAEAVVGKTDEDVAAAFPHLASWLAAAQSGDALMWRNGVPLTREEVVTTVEGDAQFFQVVRIPLLHADGRRRGQVLVGRDVTDRRRAEAATARLSRQNQLILECAGEGIAGVDAEGRTIFLNSAASRMTGWDSDELIGLPQHAVLHHSHADGTPFPVEACPVGHTLADGAARHCDNDTFWRKDGTPLAVEYSVNPMVEQDKVRGAVIVFRDIGARLAAEREIQSLLGELQRSNLELERFAYVASHDLRQPLRMITGYMSLLERRLGDRLEADEREFLGFASDGAKRMDRMIRDLLDYSRIGRGGETEAVDLNQAAAWAVASLGAAIAEAGAQVRVAPGLPVVAGIRSELERLLQNLVANAVKFRAPDRPPVVDLGCDDDGDHWVLWVKDNGIGIDPKDHDRLFAIFQRLVPQERYDGTGIGLASVRKIAEHHGGRVWVESEPGQGSTFRVALPKG